MKVYIVMSNGEFYDEALVEKVFRDRKKAEAFMIEGAAIDMDELEIPPEKRCCHYFDGKLILIAGEEKHGYRRIEWYIVESEIEEE